MESRKLILLGLTLIPAINGFNDVWTQKARLGRYYGNRTGNGVEFRFDYKVNLGNTLGRYPRTIKLRVDIDNWNRRLGDHPLRISVIHPDGTSWTLPDERDNVRYPFMERTLCLFSDKRHDKNVRVTVSTSNPNALKY